MEDKLPHTPGVYAINFDQDGRFYIGSTKDFYIRWRDHQSALRGGYHYNPHLQRLSDKYGLNSLEFVIIEHTTLETRVEREQWYMDEWLPTLNGPRLANGGFAGPHTEETKRLLSEIHTGRKHTPEAIARMVIAQTGVKRASPATPRTEEHKRKIGEANRGRIVSEETREKLRNRPIDPETTARISAANTGKKRTPEQRAAMSESRKGRKHSEETKAKIAESNRITWATRRRQNGNTDSQSPEGTTPS